MSKDNGGQAFPVQQAPYNVTQGMTLRDYFAAKALAGICADPQSINMSPETVARASYDYADAMLLERAK